MKYSEWKTLNADERKNINWYRRPHLRTATLFTIVFAITFIIVVLTISKNSTVHINRKPTAKEAFDMAKLFVKDKLQHPEKAVFADKKFKSVIDTATKNYTIQSTVKIENDKGKMNQLTWEVKMLYLDGDWAGKNNWQVKGVSILPQPLN